MYQAFFNSSQPCRGKTNHNNSIIDGFRKAELSAEVLTTRQNLKNNFARRFDSAQTLNAFLQTFYLSITFGLVLVAST